MVFVTCWHLAFINWKLPIIGNLRCFVVFQHHLSYHRIMLQGRVSCPDCFCRLGLRSHFLMLKSLCRSLNLQICFQFSLEAAVVILSGSLVLFFGVLVVWPLEVEVLSAPVVAVPFEPVVVVLSAPVVVVASAPMVVAPSESVELISIHTFAKVLTNRLTLKAFTMQVATLEASNYNQMSSFTQSSQVSLFLLKLQQPNRELVAMLNQPQMLFLPFCAYLQF